MLEAYSSLASLGLCIPDPELIFKLKQGAEPWTAEEAAYQSLPGFYNVDGTIETNQKCQDRHLWQVISNSHNRATEETDEVGKNLYKSYWF